MENTITTGQKNTATFIHLSVFAQFLFPLGNFIAPLLIWASLKRNSVFVDNHGRRALNFQMSTLLYTIGLVIIAIPFVAYQVLQIVSKQGHFDLENHFDHFFLPNDASGLIITALVFGLLLLALFVVTLFSVISAAVSASNGEEYKYPLSINFLKPLAVSQPENASNSSTEV